MSTQAIKTVLKWLVRGQARYCRLIQSYTYTMESKIGVIKLACKLSVLA